MSLGLSRYMGEDIVNRKDEASVDKSICFDVPAHGVRIFRVEGKKRIEPCIYEAEHAFLNDFDDLAKRKRSVTFMPLESASGGMTVTNLGGHKDNYALWDEVYSENGGRYKMTLYYVPSEKGRGGIREPSVSDRRIEVSVNGNMFVIKQLESDRSTGVNKVEIPVELHKGYNVVKIGSRLTFTPDIDCFTLILDEK